MTKVNIVVEVKGDIAHRLTEDGIEDALNFYIGSDGAVTVKAVEQSVHRTALPVRVLNAICYGTTLATFLWLLFGSR